MAMPSEGARLEDSPPRSPSSSPSPSPTPSEARPQNSAGADADANYLQARQRIHSARAADGTPLRRAVVRAAQAYSPQALSNVVALIDETTAHQKQQRRPRRIDHHKQNHERRSRYLAYLDDKWGADVWVPPFAREAGPLLTRQGLNQKDISYLRTLTEHAIANGKPLASLFSQGGAVYEATSVPKGGGEGPRIWSASTAKTALNIYNAARSPSKDLENRPARGSPEPPKDHGDPASLGDGYVSDELSPPGSSGCQQGSVRASPAVRTPERGRREPLNENLMIDYESLLGDLGSMRSLEQGEEPDGFMDHGEQTIQDPFETHGRRTLQNPFDPHSQRWKSRSQRTAARFREREEVGTLVFDSRVGQARPLKRKLQNTTARVELDPQGSLESPHHAAESSRNDMDHVSIGSPIAYMNRVDGQQHTPGDSAASSSLARQRTIALLKQADARLDDETVHVLQSKILEGRANDEVKALDPLHVQIDSQIPSYKPRLWNNRESPPRSLVFLLHHTDPTHWTLTIIDVPGQNIHWYDSLPCDRRRARTSTRLQALVTSSFPDLGEFSFHAVRGPVQPDGHSCGVFALAVLKHWAHHQSIPEGLSLEPQAARDDLRSLLDDSKARLEEASDADSRMSGSPDRPPAKRTRGLITESIALLREHTQNAQQLLGQKDQLVGFKPRFEHLAQAQRWQTYVESTYHDKTVDLTQAEQQHDQSLADLAKARSQVDGFRMTDEVLTSCHRAFVEQHDARNTPFPQINERAKAAYEAQHNMALDWLASREQILQDDEAEVSRLEASAAESAARLTALKEEVSAAEEDLEGIRLEVEWHGAKNQARSATKACADLLA